MTTLTKALAGLVALLLALAAWFAWQDHRAQGEREAALRSLSATQARIDAKVAELASLAHAVGSRVDTVRITTNNWRTVAGQPAPVPSHADTSSSVDTLRAYVTRLMQRNLQLLVLGDSLERSCTALANDCDVLRAKADSLPELARQLREVTERAVKATPPRRRWSPLGCSGPFSYSDRPRWGVACGPSYSL